MNHPYPIEALNQAADLDRKTASIEEWLTPFRQLPYLMQIGARVIDAALGNRFYQDACTVIRQGTARDSVYSIQWAKAGTMLLEALRGQRAVVTLNHQGAYWVVTVSWGPTRYSTTIVEEDLEKALCLCLLATLWRP